MKLRDMTQLLLLGQCFDLRVYASTTAAAAARLTQCGHIACLRSSLFATASATAMPRVGQGEEWDRKQWG
eukprot:1451199-Pleurochrysis_carterae.AAC.1